MLLPSRLKKQGASIFSRSTPRLNMILIVHFALLLIACSADRYVLEDSLFPYNGPYDHETDEDDYDERMWKGFITTWQKYPFFVHLVISHSYWLFWTKDYYCSGSLLTPEIVITTGHCFDVWDKELDHVSVWYRVNEVTHSNSEAIKYPTKAVFVHPKYEDNKGPIRYDYALVHIGEAPDAKLPEMMIGNYLFLPKPDEDKKYINQKKNVTALAMGDSFGGDKSFVLKETQITLEDECSYAHQPDPEREVCSLTTVTKFQPGEYNESAISIA